MKGEEVEGRRGGYRKGVDENVEVTSFSSRICAPSRLLACGAPVAAAHVHRYPGKPSSFTQEAVSHLLR